MSDKGVTVALALLAAAMPFSIAVTSIVFFTLLGLWLLGARWTWRVWPPVWDWPTKLFFIFLATSALSALLGLDPARSFRKMDKDFYFLIVVLVVALVRREHLARRTLKVFVIAGVLSAAWGLLQWVIGVHQTDSQGGRFIHLPGWLSGWPRPLLDALSVINDRVAGTRSHPLTYAEGLLFILGFCISQLLLHAKKSFSKPLLLGWVVSVALLFSKSRGPWLAAVGMIALAWGAVPGWRSGRRVLLFALPVTVLFMSPSLRERLGSIADSTHSSNAERMHMWRSGWTIWKSNGWLGVGPGNVKMAALPFENEQERAEGGWGHLHNSYVNLAVERGGMGLAVYFLWLASIFYPILKAFRACPQESETRALFLGALLGMAGFLFSGFTETVYNDTEILMMFYFVGGLALTLGVRHDRLTDQKGKD